MPAAGEALMQYLWTVGMRIAIAAQLTAARWHFVNHGSG
jgi:hypothetical protein